MLKLAVTVVGAVFWLGSLSAHQVYMDRQVVYMRGQIDALQSFSSDIAALNQSQVSIRAQLQRLEDRLLSKGIGEERGSYRARP